MPRPWYRTDKRSWYVTLNGKQHKLPVQSQSDHAAAIDAVAALLLKLKGTPPEPAESLTAGAAVAAFLADAETRVTPHTAKNYRYYLDPFAAHFRGCPLPLRPETVEAWSRRPSWSQTTRHNALKSVSMALRWAGHPIRLRIPPKLSAGADKVISPADFARLQAATAGDFRQLIRFLWLTGCRPSEAARLTAEMVDFGAACVRLAEHKTAMKVGRPRIIYLCSEAMIVLREQVSSHSGHLFVGERGRKPFTRHGLVCRFGHLSERTGITVTAYSFRHSFACRALSQGVPDAHVAALLGHVSTAMIHRNYGHLSEQSRVLREAAERIKSA